MRASNLILYLSPIVDWVRASSSILHQDGKTHDQVLHNKLIKLSPLRSGEEDTCSTVTRNTT